MDGGPDRSVFDCGVLALNLYLRNFALQNQKRGIVRNYVSTLSDSMVIVAYDSLAYASHNRKLLPDRLIKGLGNYGKSVRREIGWTLKINLTNPIRIVPLSGLRIAKDRRLSDNCREFMARSE